MLTNKTLILIDKKFEKREYIAKCMGVSDEIFSFIFSPSIDNTIRFYKFVDFIKSVYKYEVEIDFVHGSISDMFLPF